jgi:hypothetical protein
MERWYDREDRLCGSMLVPFGNPELAIQEIEPIQEIERVGDHPKILLLAYGRALHGHRQFHPI